MLKAEARKIFSEKRKAIRPKEKLVWDDMILIQFQKLALPLLRNVFTYAAMDHNNEVDTDTIVDYLSFRNPGLQIAYPVCDFSNWTMDAKVIKEGEDFVQNRFGTWEPGEGETMLPGEIDLIIVPLLCFDSKGFRVGYGKGFYDKFFRHTSPECIKIGLSYFDAIDKIEDSSEFDVPLNYCITPGRLYEFEFSH